MPGPSDFISSVTRPDDFDAFWDQTLADAACIPLHPSLEADPLRSTSEVEVFQVHYDSWDGLRIFGWYCLPRQRSSWLPAIVSYPGYISDPSVPKSLAREGYAAFGAAPRGKLGSNAQFNPGYPGLLTHNLVDRQTYGYRGFYIDAVRAVGFLLDRPEVDPERVAVAGSSQGGGLTVVAAALRPGVRCAAAGAPYLCGMMDAIHLTSAYPYQEIADYLRLYPEREPDVRQTLAYYDGINFAPRIRCPINVYLGLRDNVCPPETGFALFGQIGSADKSLHTFEDHGHDAGRARHGAFLADFLRTHLTD